MSDGKAKRRYYDWATYHDDASDLGAEACYVCGGYFEGSGEPLVEAHYTDKPVWDEVRYFHVDCYLASRDDYDAMPDGLPAEYL